MSPVGQERVAEAADGSARASRAEQVKQMFSEIAPTYDLLNSVLSFGLDARWRHQAAEAALAGSAEPAEVLDVATGTGKLAVALKRRCPACTVIGVDFAEPMLAIARQRAERSGLEVAFQAADGAALPFASGSFDAVTIAYGLRNFADPAAGLREFRRVLKPGGRLVVLEFPPPPRGPFGVLFRFYFSRLLPFVGGLVSGRRSAYAYLPRSVHDFLTPEALSDQLVAAGFDNVSHKLQSLGVSALHIALVAKRRLTSLTRPATVPGGIASGLAGGLTLRLRR